MSSEPLSKRERQILEILYRKGEATVAEVQAEMDDASYSAVRGLLRIMHEKGHVKSRSEGVRYIYSAAFPKDAAAKSALKTLTATFFGGSIEQVVSTLLTKSERSLSTEELDRLSLLIEEAKRGQHA